MMDMLSQRDNSLMGFCKPRVVRKYMFCLNNGIVGQGSCFMAWTMDSHVYYLVS